MIPLKNDNYDFLYLGYGNKSNMSYKVCPKCQSEMKWSHHYGILRSEKPSLFGGQLFDLAMICSKCGFIEFYLDSKNLKKLQKLEETERGWD